MKRYIAILLAALALFGLSACNKQQRGRETTAEATIVTTFPSVMESSTEKPSNQISEDAKQLLEQYEEFAVEGIVLNMKFGDVEAILGPLKKEDGSTEYTYRNFNVITPLHPDEENRICSINILSGTYMGLKIGNSSREDAEKLFGKHANDSYEEWPTGEGESTFHVADGMCIRVGYQNRIFLDYQDKVIAGIVLVSTID